MLSLALEIYRVYPPRTGTTHKRLIPDLSLQLFAEVSLLSGRGGVKVVDAGLLKASP